VDVEAILQQGMRRATVLWDWEVRLNVHGCGFPGGLANRFPPAPTVKYTPQFGA
jgi:hypothetical protein